MLKHILLWKFTENVKKTNPEETYLLLKKRFAALPGKVDGLLKLELGRDISGSEYDLVLYTEFVDEKALAAYQSHPLHVAIRDLAKDWVCGRAVVDYLV